MCGIAGIVSNERIAPHETSQVRAVNQALAHRGPDGEGFYEDAHLALAMRRLSIIDLAGGWQPLYNEDRSLVLIANGEIYNFVELRQQLISKGHTFATHSDCETILHLYEEHGIDCVRQLRGMFAFALWDSKRQRLLLARDRMGEKPLYLYEQPGRLLFASELKALLHSGMVPFELDPVAVDLYFHYQYVPEPKTPLKGVRKLDAAHVLTVDVDPWRIEESCYWRIEDAPPLTGDPATLIRDSLETVSELVIRSDVPVGVALSGGLDSSAIAALAAAKYPGTMHAFSVGYPGRPANDERSDAKKFADHLGLPFHDVELDTSSIVDFFPELIYLRDDPIADISGHGYYAVMKLARERGVPVVLQGQGGDELFWGYPWLQEAAIASLRKANLWHKGWRSLPDYLEFISPNSLSPKSVYSWMRSGAGTRTGLHHFRKQRASIDRMIFYDKTPDFQIASNEVWQLYGSSLISQLNGADAAELFTLAQPWPDVGATLTRLICSTYLRENGITQGDRLSMASSIELRLPLIDHQFVETVVGLRKAQSDVMLSPKSWLREALKDVLPDWVMNRPKRGFAPPVREWHERIFACHGHVLADGYLTQHGILSEASGRALASGPYPSAAIAPISFKALVLELWCRQMIGHYPAASWN